MSELTSIMAFCKNGNPCIRASEDYDELFALAASAFMKVTVEAMMNGALSKEEACMMTRFVCNEQIKVLEGHNG